MKKRTFLKSLGALALAPLAAITRTAEAAPPPLKKLYRCTPMHGNTMAVSQERVRMRDLRAGDFVYCADDKRVYETLRNLGDLGQGVYGIEIKSNTAWTDRPCTFRGEVTILDVYGRKKRGSFYVFEAPYEPRHGRFV